MDEQTQKWVMRIQMFSWSLGQIPEEERTPEVVQTAVRQSFSEIGLLNSEQQTPELQLHAVCRNPYAIRYIYHPTFEACFEAISRNRDLWMWIPKQFIERDEIKEMMSRPRVV